MSALKLVLWTFLSILGAIALAQVVGLINPHEKVNGLWLVVSAGSVMAVVWPGVMQSYE
jgi:carbon starvation protein